MKKRVFVSAAMAALVLAAAGCSRTAPPLEHDAEIAALLAGRWQRELSLETQISTDEANPQRVTGTVASKAITVLTLNEDQTLSLESRQEFISYTPADGAEPLPEEVVERHFSQSVTVLGTFVATPLLIEYDQVEVSIDGSAPVPFEEFLAATSQTMERRQRAVWTLEGDRLTLVTEQNSEPMEAVYIRMD